MSTDTPTLELVRQRILDSARTCRGMDILESRDSNGWRTFADYATVAGRGEWVPPDRVERVLVALLREGRLESRYRDRELQYRMLAP